MSFTAMKSIMNRERCKHRPPIPRTFQALATDIVRYEWIKYFYKGSVVAQDSTVSIIFSTDKLIEVLQEAQELFVDGTFSVSYCYFLICLNL